MLLWERINPHLNDQKYFLSIVLYISQGILVQISRRYQAHKVNNFQRYWIEKWLIRMQVKIALINVTLAFY